MSSHITGKKSKVIVTGPVSVTGSVVGVGSFSFLDLFASLGILAVRGLDGLEDLSTESVEEHLDHEMSSEGGCSDEVKSELARWDSD
ncbi:hypothetical protein CSAL01_09350 [Colletotrichum salicis]|uniref:Uncharacterized protein n=1 Tax=Colletotrichum salicis TaxID=1209931 RepID=A0A135V673_9PEZI|nr:hypothetical protein CSAL01_09350 [Colletotrichum salicis]